MTPEEWIASHVDPVGPVELVQDEAWSRVLRVPVRGGAVWFKHCKLSWSFEPRLAAALSRRWPDRVPEVIAHDEERAWLLLRDAGTKLAELGDEREIWLGTVRLYAELQRGEAAHVEEHLRHGVPDQRLVTLPGRFAAMLDQDLPVTPAQRDRLRRFTPRFAELCAELAQCGVPETIQHDDLHMHNVYVRNGRPVIHDWGDSSVAHPYFSLVATLRHVDESLRAPVTQTFLDAWNGDARTLEVALRVGWIAHAIASVRQRLGVARGVLGADEDYPRVLAEAVERTHE